jgi:hypothetical protein
VIGWRVQVVHVHPSGRVDEAVALFNGRDRSPVPVA